MTSAGSQVVILWCRIPREPTFEGFKEAREERKKEGKKEGGREKEERGKEGRRKGRRERERGREELNFLICHTVLSYCSDKIWGWDGGGRCEPGCKVASLGTTYLEEVQW